MRKLNATGKPCSFQLIWQCGLLVLGLMIFFVPVAHAVSLTWDANGSAAPNPVAGNGSWLTARNWWNGTNNVNGTWTGATPDDAVFGAGATGTYAITVGTVSANSVTFTNSGYTLTNGTLTLPNNGAITVAANQIAAIYCTTYGANIAQYWTVNTDSSLNVGGNIQGMQVRWQGAGNFNLTGGIHIPSIFWANSTVNQTGGSLAPTAYSFIGYQGGPGVYDLNGVLALLTMNNGDLSIARGGQSGTLTIQNGTINIGTTSARSLNLAASDASANNHATLVVQGGTLNVGSSGIASLIKLMTSGSANGQTATMILSGGTVNAQGIQFGAVTGNYGGGTATLTVTGGVLYLGAGGIVESNLHPTDIVTLSGGIVGASTDWASSMALVLTNLGGNITFRAADGNGLSHDISLGGVLSGAGGLTQTGGGMLTLSGASTYSGTTAINAGTILLTGGGSAAASSGFALTNGASLVLMNSAAANLTNRISNSVPITMDDGAFTFANDGSVANYSETAGALIINSGGNTVTAYPAVSGHTSTLTFSSLVHNGGSVNFQMGSSGISQNRVFFINSPMLGNWLTVNGDAAVYDSTNGLQDASAYVDIAALGSTITNAPSSNVRINFTGGGGNIQLAATTTDINSLQQNTTTAATVNMAGKILQVNQVTVNAGLASLAIGNSPGDGTLTTGSMGGNLALVNNGGFTPGLVINAMLADNVFPSALTVAGSGTVTLAAPYNSYSGGTTISNATLAVTTGTTTAMAYANMSGTLSLKLGSAGTALPMSSLTFGGSASQLAFDVGGVANSATALINISGSLTMNGNIFVNVTNASRGSGVLLKYSGTRIGTGRFVPGNIPAGMAIVDDPVSQAVYSVYISGPTVIVPPHNTSQIVVALATPQQYGAAGDGVTDDTAAFQNAMNAVNNSGGFGGGVVYVPAGVYAFSNTLTIPAGVTLHGDWADWTLGTNGVAGTLFKVYAGAGQTNGTPFITINKGAIKGISFWYPNQNPAGIMPYPFTLQISGDTLVQDVALINSYQGINAYSAAKHVLSTIIGSPLYVGITLDAQYDISHQEDVRFSPDFWPASKLPGAPAAGGPHAAWMRGNGTAELLYRGDGEACMDLNISGYNVGVMGLVSTNGGPNLSFYGGVISNCGTAYLDGAGGGNTGVEFTRITLDGDTAVDRTSIPNDASVYFHSCQLTGRNGTALHQTGGSSSTMQLQNCNVSGTIKMDGGIINVVNSTLTTVAGSNQCSLASGAIYAAFTGCNFNPAQSISNAADSRRLMIDGRRASTSPLPVVYWSDIKTNWVARRPAKLDLFVATNPTWGAVGDGVADDTAAIQSALNAASTNGGGIVYLPAGKYKLTGTLDVPGGVELRGSYPSVHESPLYDGHVKITVLQPYAGAGTTNGPPAIALEANAGIVGMTIQYELQDTNCTPYPPTIQGRGGNIYAIGVLCANPYWYVDMNTFACTNHFLQQVDGWALRYGFTIGHGSCGTLVQCMANETYWWDSNFSVSQDVPAWRPFTDSFVYHNQEWFLLGDCTELLVKNFDIPSHIFMHCIDQNGRGPWINSIITECDASVECFQFDAAAPCQINIVNPEWMVTLSGGYGDLTNYGVVSLPTFQGNARFFNAPLWGSRPWDFWIQGGDVGFELIHMGYLSTYGTKVDGGVLHLINCGFEGNTSSYYNVPFNSASPGVPGKLSEIIGCYAWTGVTNSKANINNPLNSWGDFGINNLTTQTPFNVIPPWLQYSPNWPAASVLLVWSNNMGAFNLYSTPSLAPPAWALVTNSHYFGTNRWTVTNSTVGAPQQFYRLQP